MSYRNIRYKGLQYGRTRLYFKRTVFQTLKDNGPHTKKELKNILKVERFQEKTFDRAVNDLKFIGAIIEDEHGKLFAYGHEPPETIEVHVGSPNLELTVPVKREQAKKIIEKAPELKRNKEASTVLKETGLIEKTQ